MIPDDIKARFLHEYIKSSNLEAVRNEIASGLRGPVGPAPDFRVHMIAALEAVAADIWGHGYNEGRTAELLRGLGVIADSEQLSNPYRASEGK